MADSNPPQSLDELETLMRSESWDIAISELQRSAGQELAAPMNGNDITWWDTGFDRQVGEATQELFPEPNQRKRRRVDTLSRAIHRAPVTTSAVGTRPTTTLSARSTAQPVDLVVYGANGHRREASQQDTRSKRKHRPEPGSSRHDYRNEADLKRGQTTLSVLLSVIAIIRYDCGCTSARGICNHHSFNSGTALPDGMICARCRLGASVHEIKVSRKCPPHRKHEYHTERDRLRRLGYSEESIEMNVPTVPDFIQDHAGTPAQREICERHLECAMAGVQSRLGPVIRAWSSEQRSYHEGHRALLERFPRIFSGERVKW